MTGRLTESRYFALAAVGFLSGIPLQAIGITFSRRLEIMAAFLLAASFITLAIVQVTVLQKVPERAARLLLAVSALALASAMCLAPLYALRLVEISTMAAVHGVLNSVGFALCGLLGWTRNQTRPG